MQFVVDTILWTDAIAVGICLFILLHHVFNIFQINLIYPPLEKK